MGQFALPVLIGLTAASGIYSAKMQSDAGKVASAEAQLAAKREGDAARAREIERRRALIRSLASQNAGAGAGGVTPSQATILSDVNQFNNDLLTDTANTRTQQNLYRAQGRNARAMGRAGAFTSLLDTAVSTASLSYKPK